MGLNLKRSCALCKKRQPASKFTKNPDTGRSLRTCVDCKLRQHFSKIHGPKKCSTCKKMRLSRCFAKDESGYLYGDCIYCTRKYKVKKCTRCKEVKKATGFARDKRGHFLNECIPCKKELLYLENSFHRVAKVTGANGVVYYNIYEGNRLRMVRGESVVV